LLLLPSLFPTLTASGSSADTSNPAGLSSDSPDSGKGKEISSESISDPFLPNVHGLSNTNCWNRNNSTKTFSIADDLTIQSISIHELDMSSSKDAHSHPYGVFSSASPSLVSSSSSSLSHSSPTSTKLSDEADRSTRHAQESNYFEPLSMSSIAEQHLYHQIAATGLSAFTNSAFTQSPHRTGTKEFDPYGK
jgi:hypothetical protein